MPPGCQFTALFDSTLRPDRGRSRRRLQTFHLWLAGLFTLLIASSGHGGEIFQTVCDDAWQGAQGVRFTGRLTEVRRAAPEGSGRVSALYRTLRMIFTSGESGEITWRVAGKQWTAQAEPHGYCDLTITANLGLASGWHDIETEPASSTRAGLLVPAPANPLGLISDIDDTILVTGVLSTGTLLKNSLTVTPENREAVPGMASLYRKILQKNPVPGASAVFYLSASPRQLTDNVRRFLAHADFPRGVLQLRETDRDSEDAPGDHAAYKVRHIERIFAAFPQLRFYLFGDDAERDPEIYEKIRQHHPGQIAGIWIRRLSPSPDRPKFPEQHDVNELLAE